MREMGFLVLQSREAPGPQVGSRHLPRGARVRAEGQGCGAWNRGVRALSSRYPEVLEPTVLHRPGERETRTPHPLGHDDWLRNGRVAHLSPSEAALELGLRVLAVVAESRACGYGVASDCLPAAISKAGNL